MIVKTYKHGKCTCHIDDSAYADRTPEEVEKTIETFSALILKCLRKKKTA